MLWKVNNSIVASIRRIMLWSKDFDVLVRWKTARFYHSWYAVAQLVSLGNEKGVYV